MKIFFRRYFELAAWSAALIFPALTVAGSDTHYSLCIFKALGIIFCPGCGLGHSINYLFHGDISASFSAHPLGIFAVIIIIARIYKLAKLNLFVRKNKNYATK